MSFAVLCVSFSRSEYMFDEQSHQAECLFILVITYLLFKQIINHALQLMSHLCTCENFFFSPHRISGDRLCCVHLLDGWKKVFRSPEKKNQIPLLSYRCYLTQCSALYHTEDHSNQSVWVCICGFELSEVANPSMWNLCALFQPNGISRE